jgi:hypothetical protein
VWEAPGGYEVLVPANDEMGDDRRRKLDILRAIAAAEDRQVDIVCNDVLRGPGAVAGGLRKRARVVGLTIPRGTALRDLRSAVLSAEVQGMHLMMTTGPGGPGAWRRVGPRVASGGDVGGDYQASESYCARFHRPDRPGAVVTVYAYAEQIGDEVAGKPSRYRVAIQKELMICEGVDVSDPDADITSAETWSESEYDSRPETYRTPARAEAAARLCVEAYDAGAIAWDGRAPWERDQAGGTYVVRLRDDDGTVVARSEIFAPDDNAALYCGHSYAVAHATATGGSVYRGGEHVGDLNLERAECSGKPGRTADGHQVGNVAGGDEPVARDDAGAGLSAIESIPNYRRLVERARAAIEDELAEAAADLSRQRALAENLSAGVDRLQALSVPRGTLDEARRIVEHAERARDMARWRAEALTAMREALDSAQRGAQRHDVAQGEADAGRLAGRDAYRR